MVYYLEVNIIAIVVGLLLLYNTRSLTSKNESSQLVFNFMLVVLVLFSASDIAAYCFRGKSHIGAELANELFFMLMAVGTFLWYIYICIKMIDTKKRRKMLIISSIPIALLCITIALNHFTKFYFTIDSENIYHRGTGVLVTWAVEWGYIAAALIINIHAIIHENRVFKKHEYFGYSFFFLPIGVAAVIQMYFYGTTTSQVGFMISLLMAFFNRQSHLVHKDDLTGLNNKNAFLNYRDYMDSTDKDINLTMIMMDVDDFKSINDNFGHLTGDQALKDVAEALRTARSRFKTKRVVLYRYAGDEFIVVGIDLISEEIEAIKQYINEEIAIVNEKNKKAGEGYVLGLSMGDASAVCNTVTEFDNLLTSADEAMYIVKKAKKVGR